MDKRIGDTERRGIGRRTVVRAAVVTAWTAPLVQVVAAPAFAAVSGASNLSTTSGTVARNGNTNTYNVSVTVRNSGSGATKSLTATATWAGTDSMISAIGAVTGSSWTAGSQSWTANSQIAAAGQQTFTTTVTVSNANNSGNVKSAMLTITFADPGTAGSTAGVVSGS